MSAIKEGLVIVIPAYKYTGNQSQLDRDIKMLSSLHHNVIVMEEISVFQGQKENNELSDPSVEYVYYKNMDSQGSSYLEQRRETHYISNVFQSLQKDNKYSDVRAVFILLDAPKDPIDVYTETVFEEFISRGCSIMANQKKITTGGITLSVIDGDFMMSSDKIPSQSKTQYIYGIADFRVMLQSHFCGGSSLMPDILSDPSSQPKTKKISRQKQDSQDEGVASMVSK